jgi:hypothetical protein
LLEFSQWDDVFIYTITSFPYQENAIMVVSYFKLGSGLGRGPRFGPLLFLIKKLYSDGLRVAKTLVFASNGGSVKVLPT